MDNNKKRAPRPVQQGTAQINVEGAEAAPFDIVVGNTHPDSTEEIIRDVLTRVSEALEGEDKLHEKLHIIEVECLTKPREDGSRIWSKSWRIQVPNKFHAHMMKPQAVPTGWTSRKYFPPRLSRPPVPDLDPTQTQPPGKKAHLQVPNQH